MISRWAGLLALQFIYYYTDILAVSVITCVRVKTKPFIMNMLKQLWHELIKI